MSFPLAEIEYHGTAGSTGACLAAVERLLHHWTGLTTATLVTCEEAGHRAHALLLTGDAEGPLAIKSGFASGYGGEGPTGLSSAIVLMDWHGLVIEEVAVEAPFLLRLDASALTEADVARAVDGPFVRPRRVWDYAAATRAGRDTDRNPWRTTVPIMPLAIIDDRLQNLARLFRDDPATALLRGHIRLETILRERIALPEEEADSLSGARLVATAFNGDDALLTWPGLQPSERQGRANLFSGTVAAYRNKRAHREPTSGNAYDELSEFLLLNHLFRLERESLASTATRSPRRVSAGPDAQPLKSVG